MRAEDLFKEVLNQAISELRNEEFAVYTFALYHDHESNAVSVCVDTEENSRRTVQRINSYNAKHFLREVGAANLPGAALWQANIGRSLSLGDFAKVNLARRELDKLVPSETLYLEMVKCLCAAAPRIAALSSDPSRLLFAASGESAEIAYVWAMPSDSA